MEVANISSAISIKSIISYNKTKYDTKSKLVPLKISNLNRFGLFTDSQNQEPVWTIMSIPATIFGLSTIFFMCCALVSVVTILYFAVGFLYFAVVFFI